MTKEEKELLTLIENKVDELLYSNSTTPHLTYNGYNRGVKIGQIHIKTITHMIDNVESIVLFHNNNRILSASFDISQDIYIVLKSIRDKIKRNIDDRINTFEEMKRKDDVNTFIEYLKD